MSLNIIKAGFLDTFQDLGRWGHQYLGINPGGAMDSYAFQLCNALLGKELSAPVLELHFPASDIFFEKETIISICGADFCPVINRKEIPCGHPIIVNKDSLLQFTRVKEGARAYLAILQELDLENWMGSNSTSLQAARGGWKGRSLARYDRLHFKEERALAHKLEEKDFVVLPWKANEHISTGRNLEFVIGSEWYELTKTAQRDFQEHWFQINNQSDRMGYRLNGPSLEWNEKEEMISTAVSAGTVQLLPNGQTIVLMADHQTTGGYPRIAHVISAHLPILAQKKPNDVVMFRMTDLASAEEKIVRRQKMLKEIQNACKFRIENLLNS